MDPLAIATIIGAPIIAALASIITAAIGRQRTDPFAQAQQFIDQLQKDRTSDREDRIRLEGKVDKLYDKVGALRDYAVAWELWHADGMPDPPGPPQRPDLSN